eukprot:7650441-Pyramimonas_sp.AAC.1
MADQSEEVIRVGFLRVHLTVRELFATVPQTFPRFADALPRPLRQVAALARAPHDAPRPVRSDGS